MEMGRLHKGVAIALSGSKFRPSALNFKTLFLNYPTVTVTVLIVPLHVLD